VLTLRVTTPDAAHELTTRPWTLRQWELSHKTKISKLSETGIGLEDMLWMAWRQLTDDGATALPYEQWGPTVMAIEPVEDESADPTQPALSAGS
jgi:hypothetical protein